VAIQLFDARTEDVSGGLLRVLAPFNKGPFSFFEHSFLRNREKISGSWHSSIPGQKGTELSHVKLLAIPLSTFLQIKGRPLPVTDLYHN
jgi:hypothetical protein